MLFKGAGLNLQKMLPTMCSAIGDFHIGSEKLSEKCEEEIVSWEFESWATNW